MTRMPLFLSLAALIFAQPSPGLATGFEELDTCLTDETRVAAVFSQRFPHEACTPLSACDPKLVVSAEVIATRICRKEAIAACGDDDCHDALTDRWAQAADQNDTAIRADIAQLNLNALAPLAARRIENYDTASRTCPDDPDVLQAVLGENYPEALACELYLSLTNLEATEAMGRYLSSIEAK